MSIIHSKELQRRQNLYYAIAAWAIGGSDSLDKMVNDGAQIVDFIKLLDQKSSETTGIIVQYATENRDKEIQKLQDDLKEALNVLEKIDHEAHKGDDGGRDRTADPEIRVQRIGRMSRRILNKTKKRKNLK